MMTRGMLGRILAMAMTGAALTFGTAWSFGAFTAAPEQGGAVVAVVTGNPPCEHETAHAIFTHVRRHFSRHVPRA